jgi:hypothetical protein
MKPGLPYLVVGISLLAETSMALGQTLSPMLVAQITGTAPPSGVLTAPPPAPVSVLPSGFLATIERGVGTTSHFRTPRKLPTVKRETPVRTRHQVVHWRSRTRAKMTTPAATADQSVAAKPLVVKTIPEQPRSDERGYELFLPWLGKGKE